MDLRNITARNRGINMAQREVKKRIVANKEIGRPASPPMEALERAVSDAIQKAHVAGLSTTHGNARGMYKLYPDGRRVYINTDVKRGTTK